MATVADVMDDVADECAITPPNAWTSATTLTYRQLKRHLYATVEEILDRVDFPDPLTKDTTITGTGATSYSLPSDFKRVARGDWSVYESTTTRRRCIPVTDNGQWTFLNDFGSGDGNRYYRVQGDEEEGYTIEFYRTAATGISVTVAYVTKNWLTVSGTDASTWTDENAKLLIPGELVRLGVIFRWKRAKRLPYEDYMADYEMKLARKANEARRITSISFGDAPDRPYYPDVPDFIPPS